MVKRGLGGRKAKLKFDIELSPEGEGSVGYAYCLKSLEL
jgi:hypothetical protein